MSRIGRCDYVQLEKFRKQLEAVSKDQTEVFIESCIKELASRLLASAVKRTPVGVYPDQGKNGGTLQIGRAHV